MDVLHWLSHNHQMAVEGIRPNIIPTVLIPLTMLTVGITSLAGVIAGWFGIKLHTEGPKQLLEVLLTKKVLLSMLVLNLSAMGAYKAYIYVANLPSFISTIARHSNKALPSDQSYSDSLSRPHAYVGKINDVGLRSLQLIKEVSFSKGAFRSGVVVSTSLFFGMNDGHIYELNKSDLSVRRKFFIGTPVTTRPIIFKNRIYVGEGVHDTHHARVYAFDLKSGTFSSAFATKGHTEGQPFIGSLGGVDSLFLTAGADGLYAIDPLSMKEIWHQKDGHLDATVSIENARVYTGTGSEKGAGHEPNYAVAYDFSSGKRIWKRELPISNWMHPLITKQDACYVLGEIYFKSAVGLFTCLDKETGAPHFSLSTTAPLASKPFYIQDDHQNEYAYFGSWTDEICGINITAKEKMWCHKLGHKETTHSLASFDYDAKRGVLWYASKDAGLYAIHPKTGQIVLHWVPKPVQKKWKENYASVTIDGDELYSMDIEGNLRKFKIN